MVINPYGLCSPSFICPTPFGLCSCPSPTQGIAHHSWEVPGLQTASEPAFELWAGCCSTAYTQGCLDPSYSQQRPHCKTLQRLLLSIPKGPPTLCLPGHRASHRAI